MMQRMIAMGTGGGGFSMLGEAILKVSHTLNSTTLTFGVEVDGSTVASDTYTSATTYGRVFDDTLNFTLEGKSVSWRAYSTDSSSNAKTFINDISVDGKKVFSFESYVMSNVLDSAYTLATHVEIPL